MYLSLFSAGVRTGLSSVTRITDHPLAAFVPQMSLAAGAGLFLTNATSIEFAWFVQTWVFVLFNKVCTSQVSRVPSREGTSAERSRAVLHVVAVPPARRRPALAPDRQTSCVPGGRMGRLAGSVARAGLSARTKGAQRLPPTLGRWHCICLGECLDTRSVVAGVRGSGCAACKAFSRAATQAVLRICSDLLHHVISKSCGTG